MFQKRKLKKLISEWSIVAFHFANFGQKSGLQVRRRQCLSKFKGALRLRMRGAKNGGWKKKARGSTRYRHSALAERLKQASDKYN